MVTSGDVDGPTERFAMMPLSVEERGGCTVYVCARVGGVGGRGRLGKTVLRS